MSGPSTLPPEDRALAGEYVLGVLSQADRAAFAARMARDARLAAEVAWWEAALAGLNEGFRPEPPPRALRGQIEARLFGRAAPARRRGLGLLGFVLGGAVAAGLAVAVLPWLPAPGPVPLAPGAALAPGDARITLPLAALVPTAPAFELRLYDRALVLARRGGAAPGAGQSHQAWLLPADGGAPRPLGLIPGGGADQGGGLLAILPPAGLAGAALAVSLEPAGGSPTGAPSGPVLAASAPVAITAP